MAIKKKTTPAPRDYSILSELRALRGQRLASLVGAIVGAVVPVLVYRIAHHHAGVTPALWLIVAGGLLFSASSVYSWGLRLFGAWYKAGGFTVLIELSTVFVQGWESKLALSILILINGVNLSHALVVGAKPAKRK
jgi:hypothetical protein